jgi:hypothetical protein
MSLNKRYGKRNAINERKVRRWITEQEKGFRFLVSEMCYMLNLSRQYVGTVLRCIEDEKIPVNDKEWRGVKKTGETNGTGRVIIWEITGNVT